MAASVGLIFLCFVGLDVAVAVAFFERQWLAIVWLNAAVAQLTLICVWGTLVEGTFWLRLPWTLLLLVISWAAIVVGVRMYNSRPLMPEEVLAPGLLWFFGFAASYIPLKLAALCFGWRISRTNSEESDQEKGRYAIRDMMIGTAFLAVVLAIGRAWVPGELPTMLSVLRECGMDNLELVIALSIFSFVSLVVKLPCIWISLASTSKRLIPQSISWILLSGLLGFLEFMAFCAVLGPPGTDWFEPASSMVVGHMVMAILMISVLCVLRWYGYRISRTGKT